jgi:hypothetical protein
MFILPLIIVNIVNSDKFIIFKNDFINKCINNIEPCYMDNSNQAESSTNFRRFTDNNAQNTVTVNLPNINDINELEVSGNNTNNSVTVTSNRNNIGTVNIVGLDLNRDRNFNLSMLNR